MSKLIRIYSAAAAILILAPLRAQSEDIPQQSACIGGPLVDCLAMLETRFNVSEKDVQSEIARAKEVDVNGKRVFPHGRLVLNGHFREALDPYAIAGITVDFSDKEVVTSLDFDGLPADPNLANTAKEYDATGILEAVQTMTGSKCEEANRDNLFKFFQSTVKPRIETMAMVKDEGGGSHVFQRALGIPFCSRKFNYTNRYGEFGRGEDPLGRHAFWTTSVGIE